MPYGPEPGFFSNHLIFVPFIALIVAILLKGVFYFSQGNWSFKKMINAGNMPSTHAAFIMALTTAIGMKYGLSNDLFLICLVLSCIIIYDAIHVRYQVELHAKVLNRLTHDTDEKLEESVGHTPLEALVGLLVGFIVTIMLMSI